MIKGRARSLRGIKDKLREYSQDNVDTVSAKVEELDSESELEKRVKRWLSENISPIDSGSSAARCNTHQNQANYYEANQQLDDTAADTTTVTYSEIYHPDFADWAVVVYPTQGEETPMKTKSDEILQVIDSATESLSKMMGVPFCTFR